MALSLRLQYFSVLLCSKDRQRGWSSHFLAQFSLELTRSFMPSPAVPHPGRSPNSAVYPPGHPSEKWYYALGFFVTHRFISWCDDGYHVINFTRVLLVYYWSYLGLHGFLIRFMIKVSYLLMKIWSRRYDDRTWMDDSKKSS